MADRPLQISSKLKKEFDQWVETFTKKEKCVIEASGNEIIRISFDSKLMPLEPFMYVDSMTTFLKEAGYEVEVSELKLPKDYVDTSSIKIIK